MAALQCSQKPVLVELKVGGLRDKILEKSEELADCNALS